MDYESNSNGRMAAQGYAGNQRLGVPIGNAGGVSTAPNFDASMLAVDNGPRAVSNAAIGPRVSNLEQRADAQSQNVSKGFQAIDERLRRIEEALGL
jgi:hypothetical protein